MNAVLKEVPQTVIADYSPTEQALAALRGKYTNVVFDLKTTKGDKDARAARLELVRLRTSLEVKRKAIKAPALAYAKLIDTEANRITIEIVALEKPIDEQIKADEKRREDERAEQARIEQIRRDGILAKINTLRARANDTDSLTSDQVDQAWHDLDEEEITAEVYQEFVSAAKTAKSETLDKLGERYTRALAAEQEAARLKAQREDNAREAERLAAIKREQEAQAENLRRQQEELQAQQEALRIQQQSALPKLAPAPVQAGVVHSAAFHPPSRQPDDLADLPFPEEMRMPDSEADLMLDEPQPAPVASNRPSNDDIAITLANHYRVDIETVNEWLSEWEAVIPY